MLHKEELPAFQAIREKDAKQLRKYLLSGTKAESYNAEGKNLLMLAVETEAWECADTILDSFINDPEKIKVIWLHPTFQLAVKANRTDLVKKMLGIDKKFRIPLVPCLPLEGNWTLHLAVINNNPEMIKLLLDNGDNPEKTNDAGQTPFELACIQGKLECADALTQGKYVDEPGKKGGCALVHAVNIYMYRHLVEPLLNAGASVTAKLKETGDTALHIATIASSDDGHIIKLLIAAKASVTAVNKDNHTPLLKACRKYAWTAAKHFIEIAGKISSEKDLNEMQYEAALLAVISESHLPLTKLLLENGAPCKRSNENGNVSLFIAISFCEKKPDIITLLLQHGADPNQRDSQGLTMFEKARRIKHHKCADRLFPLYAGPSPQQALQTVIDTEDLFNIFKFNRSEPELTCLSLAKYEILQKQILENDFVGLRAQRNAAKMQDPEAVTTDQDKLIEALSKLESFPDSTVKLDDNLKQTPTGKHITEYMQRRKLVNQFAQNIHAHFVTLRESIESKHWHVKKFYNALFTNLWSDGTPEHVETIKKLLAELPEKPSNDEIFLTYSGIAIVLSKVSDSWLRHPETTAFYAEEIKAIRGMRMMPAPVEEAAVAPVRPRLAAPNH